MKVLNMTGLKKLNGQKKKSITWNFFKKLDETHARCNYCHAVYNHKTTRSHLLRHIKKKHPNAILQLKNQDRPLGEEKNICSALSTDETSRTSWPAVENAHQTDHAKSGGKEAVRKEKSDIWSLFTKTDDTFAECNLCQIKLSCKYSITDLIVHREVEHAEILLKCDSSDYEELSRDESCDESPERSCSFTLQSPKDSITNDEPVPENSTKIKDRKMQKSVSWQYFTLMDKNYSRCKICLSSISHKTFSNLMRHIIRKHPCELVARSHSGEKDTEINVDDISADEQYQSEISDIEEGSEEESSEEMDKFRKNRSDAQISNKTSRRRSKRLKIDSQHHEEDQMVKRKFQDDFMDENQHSSLEQSSVSNFKTIPADKKKRTGPRSSVWKFFTKLDNGCSRCKICHRILSKNSLTGNLHRHVKRTHPSFQHMTYSTVQRIAESEASRLNQLQRELGSASPITHTFGQEAEPTLTQTVCSSEQQFTTEEQKERIGESRTACSDSGPAGGLLSNRLVRVVEEGNNLLRNLQSAVEKQGEALDRLVACLEGRYNGPKNGVNEDVIREQENDVNKDMNHVPKYSESEGRNSIQNDNENEGMNEMQKDIENGSINQMPKNDVNEVEKDIENEDMNPMPKNDLNEGQNLNQKDIENEGINEVQRHNENDSIIQMPKNNVNGVEENSENESMNEVEKDFEDAIVNKAEEDFENETMNEAEKDFENESMNEVPKDSKNEGMNFVPENYQNESVNQDQKDIENESMNNVQKETENDSMIQMPKNNVNEVEKNMENEGLRERESNAKERCE